MKKNIVLLFTLLTGIFALAQQKQENLKILWPEEYQWKIGSNQEDAQVHFVELIPGRESIDNWTMLGTMMSLKGVKVAATSQIADLYRQSSSTESPDAKLTILESDDKAKHPWIMFKVETPCFPNDTTPESQLYYAVQGESSLFVNFIAVKEKTLSKSFIEKWTKVFKSSEFVYQ